MNLDLVRVLFEGDNVAVPRAGWHDSPEAARDAAYDFYVRRRDAAARELARYEDYLKDLEEPA